MYIPDFFIIGAAKCGTSSLHYYLRQNPDVYLPREEIHFFDNEYHRGDSYYNQFFDQQTHSRLKTGDYTPNYFRKHDIVIPRIKKNELGKSPRFIVSLRDPVKRAWSHYLHMKRNLRETRSFGEAIKRDLSPKRSVDGWRTYFSDGLYVHRLKRWFHHFGRENILVVFLFELKSDLGNVVRKIEKFLSIRDFDEYDLSTKKNSASRPKFKLIMELLNKSAWWKKLLRKTVPRIYRKRIKQNIRKWNTTEYKCKPELDCEVAKKLRDKYMQSIIDLESLLHRNLDEWKR